MPKDKPIIIVEDDAEDRELLKELFEDLKIPNLIRFFDRAAPALDFLISSLEKPFLVLSDLYLPAMSGFDLLKRIREHPALKNKCIPFVFFTTASNRAIVQQAYQMHAQGFFVKPLTEEQLKQTMAAIVNYWHFSKAP
jgi:CheY-like chemotaxis protein